MSYRLIALDLDGTLLNSHKQILPESLAILAHARRANIDVMLVTGRHHVAIHPFYQALELTTPAICCNGTYLYDYPAQRVIAANPLQVAQAHNVIEHMERLGIDGWMYIDNTMIYQNMTESVHRTLEWAKSLPENQRPHIQQVSKLQQAAEQAQAIWKFALFAADIPKLKTLAARLENELGLSCEWSWFDQVDIAQSGNSKGARLASYLQTQGITPDKVIAFGDNFNDISMLESVGLGVAMGNSDKEVKASANKVIGTNDEPSIAHFLQQYL